MDYDAKDILLNAITTTTRANLERRLEAYLVADPANDDSIPESEHLESISFSTIYSFLKRGSLLEQ